MDFINLIYHRNPIVLVLLFLSISACTEKVPDKDDDQNFAIDRTYSLQVLNRFNISSENMLELSNLTRSKLREVYDYLPPMGEFSKFSIKDTLSVYEETGIVILRYISTTHNAQIRWRNTDKLRMDRFYEQMVDYFNERLGEAPVRVAPTGGDEDFEYNHYWTYPPIKREIALSYYTDRDEFILYLQLPGKRE